MLVDDGRGFATSFKGVDVTCEDDWYRVEGGLYQQKIRRRSVALSGEPNCARFLRYRSTMAWLSCQEDQPLWMVVGGLALLKRSSTTRSLVRMEGFESVRPQSSSAWSPATTHGAAFSGR